MANVSTSQLAMGPGELFVGDFGATEPADTAVALAADPASPAWRPCGATTGGITQTVTQEYKAFDIDQLNEVPESRCTKRQVTVATVLAEASFINLQLAIGSGTIDDGDDDFDVFEPSGENSGASPDYMAIIFDGVGGQGKKRRFVGRKMLSTDNVEIVASKDGQVGYKTTFQSHYVSNSIKSYRILQAK